MPGSPRSSPWRCSCCCSSPRPARARISGAGPMRPVSECRSSRASCTRCPSRSRRCRPRSRWSAPAATGPRPRTMASPRPAGVGAPASTFPPAAPAGVGAPALAAATRLIPDPVRPLGEHQPATVGLVDGPADGATEAHPAPVTVSGGNGSSHRPIPASAATMQRSAATAARRPARRRRPASWRPGTTGGRPRPSGRSPAPGDGGQAGPAQGRTRASICGARGVARCRRRGRRRDRDQEHQPWDEPEQVVRSGGQEHGRKPPDGPRGGRQSSLGDGRRAQRNQHERAGRRGVEQARRGRLPEGLRRKLHGQPDA